MSNSSPEPSPSRWVSIRRPATAMTSVSGGFAGGGWKFPESPPTPPRRRWHTCLPEKWGSLRRAPFHPKSPKSVVKVVPLSPPSNPLPMPAVSASLRSSDEMKLLFKFRRKENEIKKKMSKFYSQNKKIIKY